MLVEPSDRADRLAAESSMHRRDTLRALLTLPFTPRVRADGPRALERTSLEWVDVRATGASGTGEADDSGAIQQALDRVARGGTVYVPPGRYRIEKAIEPRFDSRFMHGVQVRVCIDAGAVLVGAIRDPAAAVITCRESPGQEGSFRIEGGIIEGMAGFAGTGLRIATANVAVDGTAIRRFSAAGIDFADGGHAPAIRANLLRVALLFNRVGLRCGVAASGMVIDRSWIEGSEEEGVILHGAGHVSIRDSVIETNGIRRRSAPQLLVLGQETTSVHVVNSYFESPEDQVNAQVVVEGMEAPVRTFVFSGNRVVGSRLPGAAGVVMGARGVVDTAMLTGNTFVGSNVGVSIGRYMRDYRIFGNSWSDSFAQGTTRRIAIDPRRSELVRSYGIGDLEETATPRRAMRRVSSDASVGPSDAVLLCDASRGQVTVRLDRASAATRTVVVKKIDASSHGVRIAARAGEHVDGGAVLVLQRRGQVATLESDGSGWWNLSA